MAAVSEQEAVRARVEGALGTNALLVMLVAIRDDIEQGKKTVEESFEVNKTIFYLKVSDADYWAWYKVQWALHPTFVFAKNHFS